MNGADIPLTSPRRAFVKTVGLVGLTTTVQTDTAIGQSDDYPSTTYGFENGLADGTVVEDSFDRTNEIAFEGSYAAGLNSSGSIETIAYLIIPESLQLRRVSFVWRESSSSYGGGILVRNGSGNMECFAGSDNPQWVVIGNNSSNGPGATYIGRTRDSASTYDRWIRTNLEFDWENNQFTVSYTDTESGDTASDTFSLNEGENVDQIELHGYTAVGYDPGSEPETGSCDMYWDQIEISTLSGTENPEQTDSPDATTDSEQTDSPEGIISSVLSIPTLIVAGSGVLGAGIYGWRRSQRAGEDTDTDTATGATDTTTSNTPSDSGTEDSGTETTIFNTPSDSGTEDSGTDTTIFNPPSDSAIGDATGDSDPQERATDLLTQAEEAETDGSYQQAADAYEEAISHLEQAIAGDDDDEESREALKAEIKETTASLASVSAVIEARESVTPTLQAAERSFKEAIARYAANEQTVARIRFRQARDAFEDAQQVIDDSDAEMLAQPIEVSFEQEATLPSLALEELAVLDESTIETLSVVDTELITDLEADPENEDITPPVVSDLEESNGISSEETALLTILSWWYEGDSREFGNEAELSQRYNQADYGFDQSR